MYLDKFIERQTSLWPIAWELIKEMERTYIKFLKKEVSVNTAQAKINQVNLQTWISKETLIRELDKIKLPQEN